MNNKANRTGKESDLVKRNRGRKIEKVLRKEYRSAAVALQYATPLQLLIAVILSAQCTDVRVNMVTPALFKRYRSAVDFANADSVEIEEAIHSTGFFRNKTKSIIACCRVLVDQHGGKVPASMEELVKLPGVGRKTANCILGGAFGISAGVVVDTHVARVSARLGLTTNTDPEKIEKDLCGILEQKDWIHFGNAVILHGRKVCAARKPLCAECLLNALCPSAGSFD